MNKKEEEKGANICHCQCQTPTPTASIKIEKTGSFENLLLAKKNAFRDKL